MLLLFIVDTDQLYEKKHTLSFCNIMKVAGFKNKYWFPNL